MGSLGEDPLLSMQMPSLHLVSAVLVPITGWEMAPLKPKEKS